jgi:hypothetical protein
MTSHNFMGFIMKSMFDTPLLPKIPILVEVAV